MVYNFQEIEFTVENGVLFVLESRNGKRTAKAALTIAVSMVTEKLINEREALLRVDPQQMDFFLHPTLDTNFSECPFRHLHMSIYDYADLFLLSVGADNPRVKDVLLGRGSGAAAGVAVGKAVFTAADAEECGRKGESCILCKPDITFTDLGGLKVKSYFDVQSHSL